MLLGSHCPCTMELGEAAACPNGAAFFPHPFRGGEKVTAVSTMSLRFQVRNPGRSQVCRRTVKERL